MKIVLTGFMGTGKTATGRILARRLGYEFVDTDALVEAAAGLAVAEIFRRHGEAFFRRGEKAVVREVSRRDKVVIATGGGAVIDGENRARLGRSGFLVALTASPGEIIRRLSGDGGHRPLFPSEGGEEAVSGLLARRMPFYRMADAVIDTDGKTPARVAREIISLLPGSGPGQKGGRRRSGACLCRNAARGAGLRLTRARHGSNRKAGLPREQRPQ